jgi:hypothetical protein
MLYGTNDHAFIKFLELTVLEVTINKPMGNNDGCGCAKKKGTS